MPTLTVETMRHQGVNTKEIESLNEAAQIYNSGDESVVVG